MTRQVARARATWHEWRNQSTFGFQALQIVLALRLGFVVLAVLAWFLFPKNSTGAFAIFEQPNFSVWHNRMLGMWGTWDASWYMQIADRGYLANIQSLAFFPLYPALVGVLGRVLGGNYLLAGLIISTALVWLVLILLHRLVTFDFNPQLARRTVLYLCAFPVVFYLFAIYTEALFLVFVLLFFLAIRQWHNWWRAGLFAALAALTRSPGVLLIIPLVWEWVRYQFATVPTPPAMNKWQRWKARLSALLKPTALAMTLPLIAAAGWGLYQRLVLNVPADAALQAQASWSRYFEWPWTTMVDSLRVFFSPGANRFPVLNPSWDMPNQLLDALFLLVGLIFLAYAGWECWRRRLPLSYLLFMGTGILLPLVSPVQHEPALSFPRFTLVLFPVFILLAKTSFHSKWWYYFSVYVSVTLQALLLARFANGFWVA